MQEPAEKNHFPDPGLVTLPEDIVLNSQIFIDKISRPGIVGMNAADPGRSQKNIFRFFPGKKCRHGLLVDKIQFGSGSKQQVVKAGGLQTTNDSRTDQTAMAGNIYLSGFIHRENIFYSPFGGNNYPVPLPSGLQPPCF